MTNSLNSSQQADSAGHTLAPDLLNYELPPFPATATELISTLNQADVEVPSVIQLIECEVAIFSKVLQLANSPIYGARRPITTIGHAIVMLGLKAVAQLALTIAAGSVFQDKSGCGAIREKTYSQSLAIATVAREIARQTSRANPDEAFLCGVVHDVGKLVLLNADGAGYSELLQQVPSGNTTAIELEAYGVSHPDLGASCGKKWGLPASINEAILVHHRSLDAVTDPLSETIIHADRCARKWQIGFDASEVPEFEEGDQATFPENSFADDVQTACEEQYAAIREICLS